LKKICSINPEGWKNLGIVLKPLNTQGSINIRNSEIYQDINNGVATLIADISTIISNKLSLDIMSPNKHLKLFKLLESDKDVDIFHDDENSQFIITNSKIRLYLPEQSSKSNSVINFKNYEGISPIGTPIKLDKNDKREVETFIKSDTSNFVNLLIRNNNIMGFEIKETGVYLFSNFVDQTDLNCMTAEVVLKSLSFMMMQGEEFELQLYKFPNEDRYVLWTVINTGVLNIKLLEEVDILEDDSSYNLI
jgi:hypothetical protein